MGEPEVLYHCMNREAVGDNLMATCEREVNGRTDKFLFATPYMTKALAFSFDYYGTEIICNGNVGDTPHEFAIICDRDETLAKPRPIRVYSFSPDGFENVGEGSRQYVSSRPVYFKDTKIVFETNDVNEIMKRGLQVFSTPKTIDQLLAENFHEQFSRAATLEESLYDLTRQGYVWENRARNLNPTPELAQAFGSLQQSKPSGPKPG
jgi:hypothetical protein